MIKNTRDDMVPMTRELAADFATMKRWKGERPFSEARVTYLDNRRKAGKLYSPVWARAYLGTQVFRLNGQHTSWIFANLNGDFPDNMKVHLLEYVCDDEHDIAELFDQFDAPGSSRKVPESLIAHTATEPSLHGLSPSSIKQAVAGISFFLIGLGEKASMDADSRNRLVHSHQEDIRWVAQFMSTRILGKRAISAAIYATYKVDAENAKSFWELVQNASHPDPKNPTRWLNTFLVERSAASSISNSNKKARWPERGIYVKCIHAWNAWRNGTHTDGKYYADSSLPEPI